MLQMAGHLARRGHKAVIAARPKTELLAQARARGLAAEPLQIAGDLNPILLWKLAAITRKHQTQIVIANTARDIRISGLVARLTRSFAVLGLHQVDRTIPNRWNYRLTFNHFADAVVVNSDATRQTLLRTCSWMRQDHLRVIHHGIDPEAHRGGNGKKIRDELRIPTGAFVLGFVGRLSGQKGIASLLAAMEIIEKRSPETHLVIAGTGSHEPKVRRFVAAREKVHYLGFRQDIPAVMDACDVMLVPSNWEGFGLVVIEAMAAGIPCIASAVSSLPEIIIPEYNGLLVPPEDPPALAAAVERLHLNPELREQFRLHGLETVTKKFTVNQMLDCYENLFSQLLSKSGQADGKG